MPCYLCPSLIFRKKRQVSSVSVTPAYNPQSVAGYRLILGLNPGHTSKLCLTYRLEMLILYSQSLCFLLVLFLSFI